MSGKLIILLACLAAGGGLVWYFTQEEPEHNAKTEDDPIAARKREADLEARVKKLCAACHAFPPPESFAKSHWEEEVRTGFKFYRASNLVFTDLPEIHEVVNWYVTRSPAHVEPKSVPKPQKKLAVTFAKTKSVPWLVQSPALSQLQFARLTKSGPVELIACEMRQGDILAADPTSDSPQWRKVAKVKNPCGLEIVDFDKDGFLDLLVADLGQFSPTETVCGRVVLFRGDGKGNYTETLLLDQVGRLADVQAGDFNGDGKNDLVVAAFGWRKRGDIRYLENQTTDWSQPKFKSTIVDERSGALNVPVADLDNDGRLDFIGLISQEYETVVAYLNRADGFEKKTLYTAPHPAWGSSEIRLVDLDKDGDLDVLYANGDTFDSKAFLRPQQGVQWLENVGDMQFKYRRIVTHYGVQRAVPADVDNDGDLDLVTVSSLPFAVRGDAARYKVPSVMILEQTKPREFAAHVLEHSNCRHAAAAVGIVDGKPMLAIGYFSMFKVDGRFDEFSAELWQPK